MADRHGASLCGSENLQVGGADEKDITSAKCRYRATSAEYARFSKAMDLPQQRERVTIDGLGDVRKTPDFSKAKDIQAPKLQISNDENLTLYFGSSKIKSDKTIFKNKIIGDHTIEEDLKAVNPKSFRYNCQKCVCTYEARRRGYNVTAKPTPTGGIVSLAGIDLKKGFPSVFKEPEIIDIFGISGSAVRKNIEKQMLEWGNGTRAIIAVNWKSEEAGHVFIAENIHNKVYFMDPQTAELDALDNFSKIKTSIKTPFFKSQAYTHIMRVDNLEFTEKIKDCCYEVGD